jgi:hypothetical protein
MRPPVDDITPPHFPQGLPWINVASLRMDKQRGRPVLIEFWDFARVQSLRTLPYVMAWHERYEAEGLRVVSVHTPGFAASRGEEAVQEAVDRLGIEHAVLVDDQYRLWTAYDNEGWPARYLWAPTERGHALREFHYGEGDYAGTELAIQELLGVERDLVAPVRPEDHAEARVVVPTSEQRGAWSGPYEAGGVWAVLSGSGVVRANGREVVVDHPGAYPLLEHPHHTAGVLELDVPEGVLCEAVSFTPGVVPPGWSEDPDAPGA